MRIKKLEMKNFRGFEELMIEFPEKGNSVFVGVNGSGKTSVLDCIKILLDSFLWNEKFQYPLGFGIFDIKIGNKKTENILKIEIDDRLETLKSESSEMEIGGYSVKTDEDGFSFLNKKFLKKIKTNSKSNIPLFLFYPTKREIDADVSLEPKSLNFENQFDAFSYYYGINFKDFFQWFRSVEDFENEVRLQDRPSFRDKRLEVIRKAIKGMLPHFSEIRVRRTGFNEFIAKKGNDWLSLGNLSHGEKLLLALIGDIARRLSIANPSLDDPLQGEGIILIDEIELHLHPSWQRTIVPRLEKTFPNIQFILTTHSPQVLSTMKRENVFILEDFQLVENTPHTEGKDSNSILYEIFGISKRPKDAKEEFEHLYELIDNEDKVEEAREKYEKMKEKYGEFDPEILRAGMHLDF